MGPSYKNILTYSPSQAGFDCPSHQSESGRIRAPLSPVRVRPDRRASNTFFLNGTTRFYGDGIRALINVYGVLKSNCLTFPLCPVLLYRLPYIRAFAANACIASWVRALTVESVGERQESGARRRPARPFPLEIASESSRQGERRRRSRAPGAPSSGLLRRPAFTDPGRRRRGPQAVLRHPRARLDHRAKAAAEVEATGGRAGGACIRAESFRTSLRAEP